MTKIIVIDDDIAINELIKINLELQGYEVLQAYNGSEGFALAKQEQPALIVLDVMMPEVDGYTVAQRIRQCEPISDTPIIMLTALSQLNDKVNGFNIGVDDYLTKPFETEELIVRVRALLKRSGNIPKSSAIRDLQTYKEITLLPEMESSPPPVFLILPSKRLINPSSARTVAPSATLSSIVGLSLFTFFVINGTLNTYVDVESAEALFADRPPSPTSTEAYSDALVKVNPPKEERPTPWNETARLTDASVPPLENVAQVVSSSKDGSAGATFQLFAVSMNVSPPSPVHTASAVSTLPS